MKPVIERNDLKWKGVTHNIEYVTSLTPSKYQEYAKRVNLYEDIADKDERQQAINEAYDHCKKAKEAQLQTEAAPPAPINPNEDKK